MTDGSSRNHRQGFDRFCHALLWHQRGRPAVIRPIYASTEREESASTKREAEAAARLEWLDSNGAFPELPRAEDTQSDESVAERDRVWAERILGLSTLELIQIIRAELDELDERDTKKKLSYFSHMLDRCPWLGRECPALRVAATNDPHAPYMPARWFRDEFGIKPDRLRATHQRHPDRLRVERVNGRPRYSVPDAAGCWPDDVTHLPEGWQGSVAKPVRAGTNADTP